MADVVRLAIVYDTSQAAAQLAQLNQRGTQAGRVVGHIGTAAVASGARIRGLASAGIRLASSLSAGNVSALSLASSLGRLAGPTAAAGLLLTVVNLINAFQEFNKIVKDVNNTIDDMQTKARDARRDVAQILGEVGPETKTEQAIKRLRDAAAAMRREAARLGGGAGKLLEQQAAALEAEIPGIGGRAKKATVETERRRLIALTNEYNRSLEESNTILSLLNAGPLEQMNATMDIYRKRLEVLVHENRAASEEAQQLALLLRFGAEAMANMSRKLQRIEDLLTTASDSVEEFVVTGTLAFTDFLNNILRLLYRDAAGQLIGGIVRSAAGSVGGGNVNVGQPQGPTPDVPGQMSVVAPVTFNVFAYDSQDTARWIQQNGARIAAEVAGHAERSSGLRRKFARG